jgi:hypothetical protein
MRRKIVVWVRRIGDEVSGVFPEQPNFGGLPTDERNAFAPFLELVPLQLGAALCDPGGKQAYVYFPADSIISLLYMLESGASAEIAVTGNEGVVGISPFMGGGDHAGPGGRPSAGSAYRLKASIIKKEFRRGGAPVCAAAFYAGHNHADGANRRVQSPPFRGSAALSLAALESRPAAL